MAKSRARAQTPYPFSEIHPKFRVHGWSELLRAEELVLATEMVRHFIVTGETGSGKSVSAVMRLLESILRYPEAEPYSLYANGVGSAAEKEEDLRPAVLVVDPKEELEELVGRESKGRKVTRIAYGEAGLILDFFEGRRQGEMDAFEVMDLILMQSDFYVMDQATTREPIWNMQAGLILKDLVAIDMWLAKQSMDHVKLLWDGTREALEKCEDFKSVTANIRYDPNNYFKPMAALLGLSAGQDGSLPMACYLETAQVLDVPGELTVRLVTMVTLYHSTRSGVVWMANGILADIALDEFAACVCLNPLEPPPPDKRFCIKDALDGGDAVVYVPSAVSPMADMAGRCIKSKFFEFAFQRENKIRPFFYVVDEAHRFLTAGEQDGEQSLLDRCRAFRTGVLLSTQSIASMSYRLERSAGSGFNALQIILNNCGNALYFRTSDIHTQENLRQRIPDPPFPNRPHVIKVRPLTTLPVGSCYALRANGTWGLFQVHLPPQLNP